MEADVRSENERIKHLEFIQATIARLGNNVFLIRGWSVTATGVLLAVSVQVDQWRIATLALLIGLGFWALDGFYLRRERMFRRLYDDAALHRPPRVPLFSMDTRPYLSSVPWTGALFSDSVMMVHLPVLTVDVAVACVLAF